MPRVEAAGIVNPLLQDPGEVNDHSPMTAVQASGKPKCRSRTFYTLIHALIPLGKVSVLAGVYGRGQFHLAQLLSLGRAFSCPQFEQKAQGPV